MQSWLASAFPYTNNCRDCHACRSLTVFGGVYWDKFLTHLRPHANLIRHKIIGRLLCLIGMGKKRDKNRPIIMYVPRLRLRPKQASGENISSFLKTFNKSTVFCYLHSHSHLRTIQRVSILPICQMHVFGLEPGVPGENLHRRGENLPSSCRKPLTLRVFKPKPSSGDSPPWKDHHPEIRSQLSPKLLPVWSKKIVSPLWALLNLGSVSAIVRNHLQQLPWLQI